MTNATMASTLSNTPTVAGGFGAAALGGAAAVPGLAAADGAAALGADAEASLAPGAGAAARAAGAAAAAAGGGAAPAGAAGTETAGVPAGAGALEAGKVGNLIVGEAVGLGGSAIRTVSFFGWTLASAGLGGGPPGVPVSSAIILMQTFLTQPKTRRQTCQTLSGLQSAKK